VSTASPHLSESPHKKARELAQSGGVSINQLITTNLAEKISTPTTADYLRGRSAQGF
jgi:hypothetical protein